MSACPPMEVRKPQDLLFFNSGFSFVSAIEVSGVHRQADGDDAAAAGGVIDIEPAAVAGDDLIAH